MIEILGNPFDPKTIIDRYSENSVEFKVLNKLSKSRTIYRYNSLEELSFELKLRKNIVSTAKKLDNSHFAFETFRKSKCNPKFWERTKIGGFLSKRDVKASEAIEDIFINSSKYATECATAMVIIYYKALLNIYPEELFNQVFPRIYLMNWHNIDYNLREIGYTEKEADYLPGDRRYFKNPDVDPRTPEWQGENVIYLGNGAYYGHGIGITTGNGIIKELNSYRRPGAERSAYLLDVAARPNFKHLAGLYYNFQSLNRVSNIFSKQGVLYTFPYKSKLTIRE